MIIDEYVDDTKTLLRDWMFCSLVSNILLL